MELVRYIYSLEVKYVAVELFEYNKVAYEAALAILSESGKAAVIHPTDTGKSFIWITNGMKCLKKPKSLLSMGKH